MASLTRSALRQAAQQNLGIKDRDSDFNRWIDQGLKRIAGEHDFKALKDSESSTMTASTGTSIDFPSNYKSMRSFVIQSDSGYNVDEIDEEQFDEFFPYPSNDSEGVPVFLIARSDTIYDLYPVPDDNYTYVMRYSKWPTALSADTTSHPFPEYMDALVEAAATLTAFESYQQKQDIVIWEAKYRMLLLDAIKNDTSAPTRRRTMGRFQPKQALPSEYWLRPDVR